MIAIVGCGNANRSDDGVGPWVVADLRSRGIEQPGIRLLDAGTNGAAVMFAARGCETLIIVDACQSGSLPGAVFEVPGAVLEQPHRPALTLHDFRWDHAIHAGRLMFRESFPSDVTVLLVEAETVAFGLDLSAAVTAAGAVVAARIEGLIRSRQAAAGTVP